MRILLADDHDLFAEMAKFYLERGSGEVQVEIVANFAQARARALASPAFDLILLDLHMPGMQGLSGLTRMMEELPGVPVAIMSGSTNRADIRAALRTGCAGFIPKTLRGGELTRALESILRGQRYIPKSLMVDYGDDLAPEPDGDLTPATDDLTAREGEVFEALLAGSKNKEIAARLGISEVTVKIHLRNIFTKIGARNRGDAIRIGLTRHQRG